MLCSSPRLFEFTLVRVHACLSSRFRFVSFRFILFCFVHFRIFVNGDMKKYKELKKSSINLGAAFQKVNFLRDLQYDTEILNH